MRVSSLITFSFILSIVLSLGCGQSDAPGSPAHSTGQLPPKVVFTVSPTSAAPGTDFHVDASDASSQFGEVVLRWDFEDDGVWDTDFSTERVATHAYTSPGYKKIRLEVRDDRQINATTTREVFVTSNEMVTNFRD